MNRYFDGCRTAEELKKRYREVAKQLHPDNGGDPEQFKAMQAEFASAWERCKNIHVNKDGDVYTKETDETAEEFMDIIEKIINLDGVTVELCGSWIWCSGDTKPHRELFLSAGFHWSGNKQAWSFHHGPYRKRSSSKMSLDEIRNFYGSKKFKKSGKKYKSKVNHEHEEDEEAVALLA